MQEIVVDTIGALRDTHLVYAFCTACRRDTQLDLARLAAVYGGGLTLGDLRERLTCRRCGGRSREIRIVYGLPPGSNTYGRGGV